MKLRDLHHLGRQASGWASVWLCRHAAADADKVESSVREKQQTLGVTYRPSRDGHNLAT